MNVAKAMAIAAELKADRDIYDMTSEQAALVTLADHVKVVTSYPDPFMDRWALQFEDGKS